LKGDASLVNSIQLVAMYGTSGPQGYWNKGKLSTPGTTDINCIWSYLIHFVL
jgi:hypothetical protein